MQKAISEMIHNDMLAITRQVAGISLEEIHPAGIQDDAYTLHLSATGSYDLNLFLYADKDTLQKIADNMKRSPATDSEVSMYVIEFFNILGGRIVSRINKLYQQNARFAPPKIQNCRVGIVDSHEHSFSLHYGFQDGSMEISGDFSSIQ